MRGRPPKPTALKRLAGNPGKRRLPEEPEYGAVTKLPRAPRGLGKYGRALWRSVGRVLVEAGVLTRGDLVALQLMCIHYDLAMQALDEVRAMGITVEGDKGTVKKNPALQVWRDNARAFKEFAAHFGLTPAARAKIATMRPPEDDLWELLFGENGGDQAEEKVNDGVEAVVG